MCVLNIVLQAIVLMKHNFMVVWTFLPFFITFLLAFTRKKSNESILLLFFAAIVNNFFVYLYFSKLVKIGPLTGLGTIFITGYHLIAVLLLIPILMSVKNKS